MQGTRLASSCQLLGVLEGALIGTVCVGGGVYFFSNASANSVSIVPFAVLQSLCIVALMHSAGLYDNEALLNFKRMLWRIGIIALPIFLIAIWITQELARHAVVRVHPYYWKWTLILTGIWLVSAVSLRVLFRQLHNSGLLTHRILILGAGEHSAELADLSHVSQARFQILDQARAGGAPDVQRSSASLIALAQNLGVSEIVVAGNRESLPMADLIGHRPSGIRVTHYPDFYEREGRCVCVEGLDGDRMTLSRSLDADGFKRILRRSLDVLLSGAGLIAVAPILLITAFAIKLEDGGPVIYPQERVGLKGRSFVLLKFRSMRVDAESDGTPAWARERDNRITRVGRIIRRIRADELPQLLNVLRGDMAVIGPRPERPFFVRQFSEAMPAYDQRHEVRPGITGWAQVCFRYGASFEDTKRKLSYDLYYIKHQSLLLDALILLKTIRVVLSGEGAR